MSKSFDELIYSDPVGLSWFVAEFLWIFAFFLGAVITFWDYTPFNVWTKLGVTALSCLLFYDLFRSFIYVKWIIYINQ